MGSVAAMEDTPSLEPGGRYPGTASARRVCVSWHGMIFFARSTVAAPVGRAPGPATGV